MAGRIWIPGGGGGADLDVVTAGAEHILTGKTIVNKEGNPLAGTMPDKTGTALTVSTNGKTLIPKGYHDGTKYATNTQATMAGGTKTPTTSQQTIACNGKLMTSNIVIPAFTLPAASSIKKGVTVTIYGKSVTGTFEGYVTSPTYLLNGSNTWANLQTTGVTCTSYPSWFANCDYTSKGTYRDEGDSWISLGCQGNSSTNQSGVIICRLNQTVNLSSYKYIKWSTTLSCWKKGTLTAYLGVSTSSSVTSVSSLSSKYSYSVSCTSTSEAESSAATMISDVSSLSGNYYIYFALNISFTSSDATASLSGSKLWLANS